MPGQVDDVRELDPGFFRQGFLEAQCMVSPWHQWLDAGRYQAYLDEFRVLGASVAVGAHGVALHGDQIDGAFDLLGQLPGSPPAKLMAEPDLEMILSMLPAPPVAA